MNFYTRSTDPIGTPAVRAYLKEDLYLSLLAFSPEPETASFNVWIFPLMGWLWGSLPFFVVGSLIALSGRRSRKLGSGDEKPGQDPGFHPRLPAREDAA